jgi:quercetin dioxygenase-like cupin family protein
LYHDSDQSASSTMSCWTGGLLCLSEGTHFGFVVSGTAQIETECGEFNLSAGMYFSIPGSGQVRGEGRGVAITRHRSHGLFQIGGPIESKGRLQYIDGCSDTLLISPVVCGDACLNLLHIPVGTRQTQHTHPSLRAGVVVKGTGVCQMPDRCFDLSPEMLFVIPAETEHSFHTDDSELVVIAYHPDSDTGPTHDDHPMVNRTMVNGVSARSIKEIRT